MLGRRGRYRLAHRRTTLLCLFFLFLLLGLNGLQHVAGLGDMREIDLGRNALRGARRWGARLAGGSCSALKMLANLLCLGILKRTGVGLAAGHAEFRENVDNRARLNFQLAREIVDTNLTHPPLFKICYPKPLVVQSYLMAMAALQNSLVARLAFKIAAHLTRRSLWPPARPMLRFRFRPIPSPALPHPLPRERSRWPAPPR